MSPASKINVLGFSFLSLLKIFALAITPPPLGFKGSLAGKGSIWL